MCVMVLLEVVHTASCPKSRTGALFAGVCNGFYPSESLSHAHRRRTHVSCLSSVCVHVLVYANGTEAVSGTRQRWYSCRRAAKVCA